MTGLPCGCRRPSGAGFGCVLTMPYGLSASRSMSGNSVPEVLGSLLWNRYDTASSRGVMANCLAALLPIMRAISVSGTAAARSRASASQALVVSWWG
jgi:hypothetical protein